MTRAIKEGIYQSEAEMLSAGLTLLEKHQQTVSPQKQALMHEMQLGIDELDAALGVTLHSREEITAHLASFITSSSLNT